MAGVLLSMIFIYMFILLILIVITFIKYDTIIKPNIVLEIPWY